MDPSSTPARLAAERAARRPLQIGAELALEADLERSIKILPGQLQGDRYTLIAPSGSIDRPTWDTLIEALAPPGAARSLLNEWFVDSSSFGFGVERSGDHCSHRIYCERWDAMVADLMALPERERRGLCRQPRADWPVPHGLKWNPLEPAADWAITGYDIAPLLDRDLAGSTFLALVDRLFPATPVATEVRQLVEGALAGAPAGAQALLLQARGDGARDSLDLNLGDFALPLSSARRGLERIMAQLGSPDQTEAVSATIPWNDSLLTHLSVGSDRQGRRFLTVYFPNSLSPAPAGGASPVDPPTGTPPGAASRQVADRAG